MVWSDTMVPLPLKGEGFLHSIISLVSAHRDRLYASRSGTVRLPLQSAGYCDTPLVLWLPFFPPSSSRVSSVGHPFPPLSTSPFSFSLPASSSPPPANFFFYHLSFQQNPYVAAGYESRLAYRATLCEADGLFPFLPNLPATLYTRGVDAKIIYVFLLRAESFVSENNEPSREGWVPRRVLARRVRISAANGCWIIWGMKGSHAGRVQGFWNGAVSTLEKICISLCKARQYDYHLFFYFSLFLKGMKLVPFLRNCYLRTTYTK